MAYNIAEHDEFLEVSLSGHTSKEEILSIVSEMARRDPHKKLPDMWLLSEDSMISFQDLIQVADAISAHIPADVTGTQTAFVTSHALQKAELELYISEAIKLGLDMRIFDSRDNAVTWITHP